MHFSGRFGQSATTTAARSTWSTVHTRSRTPAESPSRSLVQVRTHAGTLCSVNRHAGRSCCEAALLPLGVSRQDRLDCTQRETTAPTVKTLATRLPVGACDTRSDWARIGNTDMVPSSDASGTRAPVAPWSHVNPSTYSNPAAIGIRCLRPRILGLRTDENRS